MSDRDPAAAVFEALADPMRRRLLQTISTSPSTATELAGELPISRQAVAKHLPRCRRRGCWSASARAATCATTSPRRRCRTRSPGSPTSAASGTSGWRGWRRCPEPGAGPARTRTDHWPVTPVGFGLMPKYGTAQPTIFWNAGPATVPP